MDHLDVGQANELKLAFRRFGLTNSHVKRLCEGDYLGDVLQVLRGDAQIMQINRTVNLSAEPVLKDGESVVKHLKQGEKPWHQIRLALMEPDRLQYTHPRLPHEFQRLTFLNRRTKMPKYLAGQRPANICMRDFLVENQHLIPWGWHTSGVFLFWGTVCKNKHTEYVPGMHWSYGKWEKMGRRIDEEEFLGYDNPAVVFAPAVS